VAATPKLQRTTLNTRILAFLPGNTAFDDNPDAGPKQLPTTPIALPDRTLRLFCHGFRPGSGFLSSVGDWQPSSNCDNRPFYSTIPVPGFDPTDAGAVCRRRGAAAQWRRTPPQ
jgi:hypothetical protein